MTATAPTLPGLDPRPEVRAAGEVLGEGAGTTPAARVIGLDLSLTATGMSDASNTWLIRSAGGKDDTLVQRWTRLRNVARNVCDRIPADTALVVIEGPSFGQQRQTGQHDRAGLWWLIVSALHSAGVPVAEVPPASLKLYATGKGTADKGQVIEAAVRRYPDVEIGGNDGRADALWLAQMGLGHLTGLHVVPAAHLRALDKVRWPQ